MLRYPVRLAMLWQWVGNPDSLSLTPSGLLLRRRGGPSPHVSAPEGRAPTSMTDG